VLALVALSNDVPMSVANDSNGRPSGSERAEGVLANLPRTRPQRSTARRTASRSQKAAAGSAAAAEPAAPAGRAQAKPRTAKKAPRAPRSATASARKAGATGSSAARKTAKGAKPGTRTSAGKRSASTPRRPVVAADEHVPLQGFESEMDRASGPVEPPGGTELVATAVEIIGEIARAGLSTGERLVRDALARLPLS
jgi:hypothetical protein